MSNEPMRRILRDPPGLDLDRLIRVVQEDIELAAKRWQLGRPHDEAAFLNHLTGILGRRRRGCDVGKTDKMHAQCQLYYLHREEEDSSDKYGADLAVTLRVGASWTKTAIFQMKKAKEYKFRLDEVDLKAADEDTRIAERSFLMAIDEDRLGIRIEKIQVLKQAFDRTRHSTITCQTGGWYYLTDWVRRWLRCELSPPTRMDDPTPVEGLLEAFRFDGSEADEDFDFQSAIVEHLASVPAKDWLKIAIKKA